MCFTKCIYQQSSWYPLIAFKKEQGGISTAIHHQEQRIGLNRQRKGPASGWQTGTHRCNWAMQQRPGQAQGSAAGLQAAGLRAAGRVPHSALPFPSTCHLLCRAEGMARYREMEKEQEAVLDSARHA